MRRQSLAIAGAFDDDLVAGVGQPVQGAVAQDGVGEETEPLIHGVVELAYRPELWYATDKSYLFLNVPLIAFNGLVHYRLRTNRTVTWRWLLFLSAMYIALISAAVIIGGEFHLLIYVAYSGLCTKVR
jgi:hypothetical protein